MVWMEKRINTDQKVLPVKWFGEYREELEDKLSALVNRYEEIRLKYRAVFRHHMSAYPNLKSSRYAKSLEDMKKRLEKLRKEK